MKKLLLVAAISVMLVGCNSSHTALSQTSSNANAAASNAVQSIASVEKQLPDWIKDDTVTSPLEAIVMGGHTYDAVSFCKPHDCASDFMITLTSDDNHKYSMIVHVKDVPDALNTPSIYATYQYIGQPDQQVKSVFTQALSQNPNWQ
ncbi:lysozyme inhibitor [Photobacterium kishitanii]|uniref:Lysozyme inhibitor n=1 Tax=Photobacterium kishitanii TaxID=318456 RepID=A0A2T3KJZ2_9GAMM|nr:Ivy family c-type lysozyme inhibitor [Photobacterium kishitanii]KJG59859.1 lysozyme inhibitor [Photobacterium kishitanii]KJG63142.1 lysozyme inhibitor [Photobacterium kishitanii]KJG67847.1 lysozyme inhibitor [Photobacterium kishitanii]KJG71314.1 lysozyme inhibitor [Photobacterium kishitanii]OBU27248.1 lysozyme inhibitor [Photobacterium kishitanii]